MCAVCGEGVGEEYVKVLDEELVMLISCLVELKLLLREETKLPENQACISCLCMGSLRGSQHLLYNLRSFIFLAEPLLSSEMCKQRQNSWISCNIV